MDAGEGPRLGLMFAATLALLLLGDSLAVGMAPHWPGPAQAQVGASSFVGWEHLARGRPFVLVVGSNDLPGHALRARLVDLAALPSLALVVGPPCAVNRDMDRRLAAVTEIQRNTLPPAQWLDLRTVTVGPAGCRREGRAPDGLHFTPQGYAELAAVVRERLR